MIRVTCDGCEAPIDRDAQPWYGVDLTEPIEPLSHDPVEAMNEAEEQTLTALKVGFGGDHAAHFCSASCLAGWAFTQDLDKENP